jgi:hypothetical protein
MTSNSRTAVKSLCDAAQSAWDHASGQAREVHFTWRGKEFVSTLTNFRMLVADCNGQPVCCRWF